jgi:peptidoglycan/xylan/chitin deacetylase (PgdA/CDA1 family)
MKVTLSFDNGPSAPTTNYVLDALHDLGVLASFFVVGDQLRDPENRAAAERAHAEGHWIGNHTLTHSIQFGDSDDGAHPEREIGQAQALIGELATTPKLFRPYGGGGVLDNRLLSTSAIGYLRDNGYTTVLWNCVPHDWDDPEGWVETCLSQLTQLDWGLVVLHDLPTGAMTHLPQAIESLRNNGADLVQDFPPSCIAINHGSVAFPLAHLTGGVE